MSVASQQRRNERTSIGMASIDTDVHPVPRSVDDLREYLPSPWSTAALSSLEPSKGLYAPPAHKARIDATPPGGGPAGSDPAFTRTQLLGESGIEIAILIPLLNGQSNLDLEALLHRANNQWLASTWLDTDNDDGRFRGSINVPVEQPSVAVREIDYWADHRWMVQVRVDSFTSAPLGDERYHPIYAAAHRHGLPVAVHFAKGTGPRFNTPVGFQSYYFEHHSLCSLTYAAHLVSLIMEGVFDRFEGLQVVFAEGGVSWVLPVIWRLERQWRARGPWAKGPKRSPMDYLRENVRLTTQPIEEPRLPDFRRIIDELPDVLMFSTDYPHWDFDDPLYVARRLPESRRNRVLRETASELYGLRLGSATDLQRQAMA